MVFDRNPQNMVIWALQSLNPALIQREEKSPATASSQSMQRAVAAREITHLSCRSWLPVTSMHRYDAAVGGQVAHTLTSGQNVTGVDGRHGLLYWSTATEFLIAW